MAAPTGAAFLTLVDGFGPMPDMQIDRIGCGAGHRELKEQANILRVMVGSAAQQTSDEVVLLRQI
ncbi:MAG: nickel insertion protein [Pirellulaceae bacterium]